MKKKVFIVILMTLMSSAIAFAQDVAQAPKKYAVYCELVGREKLLSTKVTVSVDFGQAQSLFSSNTMVDEKGNQIVFNSMVDAMNYMGKLGWVFEAAYMVGSEKQGFTYHWLLRKDIAEGEEVDIKVYGNIFKSSDSKKE